MVLACGASATPRPTDAFAGVYRVEGGGAPLDVFNALSAEFSRRHPGVKFDFQDTGSSAGMTLVASGDTDLATSSADPPAAIRDQIDVVPVGVSGTAVIVAAGNPVTALTRSQVGDIFSGKIRDWIEVGGRRGPILVCVREVASAIRSNFEAFFFTAKPSYPSNAIELNNIDQMINAVAGDTATIGYLTINQQSLSESRIRMLSIDGVAATRDNLRSGSYPVRRPLYLVANHTRVKPAIAAFLEFVRGPDGQRIIDSTTS